MGKKSSSEKGHATNLANFEDVLVRYQGFGPLYNPTRQELQLPYLQQVFQEARTALDQLIDANTTESNATNTRKATFKNLPTFVTRVINALAASGADKATMEDAKAIKRKLDGKRASKLENENNNDATSESIAGTNESAAENGNEAKSKQKSSSQRSYDLQVEHFARLVSLIQSMPNYNPNEPELQLGTLQSKLYELRSANTMVTIAEANVEAARRERNRIFYQEMTGLVPLALQSKLYVKSIFGATSAAYKQIHRISFRMFTT